MLEPEVFQTYERGRPPGFETRRRTALFLGLCAQGMPVDEACVESGVLPMRALRLIADPGFPETLTQIRGKVA